MQLFQDGVDTVRAADAASRAPAQAPAARGDDRFAFGWDRGLYFDALAVAHDPDVLQVAWSSNQFFRNAEPHDEVLEIRRRRHHHDVGNAVIHEHDRRLFDDLLAAFLDRAVMPGASAQLEQRPRVPEAVKAEQWLFHL